MLMTFADRTCGMTARYVSGKPTLATVQLDTHFVEAGKIGEVLVSKPHVVRSTRSLIFITHGSDRRQALYRHGERRVQDIEERELGCFAVIASEAKQSSGLRDRIDCLHIAGIDRFASSRNDDHQRRGPTRCNTATSAAAA